MSLISRARPPLVLIENVPGLKDERVSGDVEWNAASDIVRTLLTNGYQVRYGVLDAASYGAPQYRHRLFILGARRGTPLPRFPTPTQANARPCRTLFLSDDFATHDGTGPFPPLTAEEAIGDLPSWSYAEHGVYDPFKTEVGMRRCAVGPPRSRYAQDLQSVDRQAREHVTEGVSRADYQK